MAVDITRNKQVGRAAAWWLYEGATFTVYLMDTTGAASPPDNFAPYDDWISPTDYRVDSQLELTLTGGSVDYGSLMDTHIVYVPQLVITLNYPTLTSYGDYTFTDLVVTSTIAKSSSLAGGDPAWAGDFTVATIHEDPAITMDASDDTKIYYLDITATSAVSELEA